MTEASGQPQSGRPAAGHFPKVIILTTAMLTFISLWRAAAVVLSDLASTAYYIGGIAQTAIGEAAPWFIVGVMLFSICVRAVYVESCSMFVRGGVYRIVKEAMGLTLAKVAVSALVFDFVLTGPISSVSAGHYVHGLLTFIAEHLGMAFPVNAQYFSCVFALLITSYFWRLNIKGIEESSDKALKIMWVTAGMVAILLAWALITIVLRHCRLPAFRITLGEESLGWLNGYKWATTAFPVMMVIAFGHSLLAMSGEETLAQVYREIEAPKHKNLIRAAIVIFVFSFLFTGVCNLAAFMIIPEAKRLQLGENLLNGLVMELVGPTSMRLLMTAFVVGVGGLILSGAVNTAIIGSNGVLNRVAEDGVLDDWFRHPHRKFGTTYRIINMVVILQLVTIAVSRGSITLLGEAYAFGVVWSFAFMCLSMLILRFRYKGERPFRVPLNFTVRGVEIPLGLGMICLVLLLVAVTNLLTKQVATVSGATFTAILFAVFSASEWHAHRKRKKAQLEHEHREKFILERKTELTPEVLDLPQGRRRVLVPVRDPNNLSHLKAALDESHEKATELIVMTIKVERGEAAFQHVFTSYEERLFTRVVQLAEEYGETIVPIVVPSNNSWFAIARTAHEIHADEIVLGKSGKVPPDVQMEQLALMWGMVSSGSDEGIKFRIIAPGEEHSATL